MPSSASGQVGAERAVEKMENSIQNIILQEIEQLDGILIATTNLAENMDKAFERRFLYKIQFEKPDLNCRTQIWQAMIPPLNDADASYLAGKDFSGGEIENIARHFTIQTILHGKSENMVNSLAEFCESERMEGSRIKLVLTADAFHGLFLLVSRKRDEQHESSCPYVQRVFA